MRLLVIEDYAPLANSVCQGFREAGYAVELARDGAEGLALAMGAPFDALILDVMLPGLDGFEVLKAIRAAHRDLGVVLLTARDAVKDRVHGLDLGADDYLVKPFAFEELLARVRSVIRRRYKSPTGTFKVGDLELDASSRIVTRAGIPIVLSAKEFALLEYLISRRGEIVTRAEIWDHAYDFASEPSSNVVDVYIGYLRKKIDQGHEVKLIHTRRGQGYVVEVAG